MQHNIVEHSAREEAAIPELTIVAAGYNEGLNVERFFDEVIQGLSQTGKTAEILFIDDGSTDQTAALVTQCKGKYPQYPIRLISHASNKGITASIQDGIEAAHGEWVCLLPSDLESSPKEDIPKLCREIAEDVDLVCGYRIGRKDGKEFASRVYNQINERLFGLHLRDANWIKLFRRDLAEGLELRSDWHRFLLPILCYKKRVSIKEVGLNWHPRVHGSSNFGLKRFPISLANMVAVKLKLDFGQCPMLLMGWLALYLISFALLILVVWGMTPVDNVKLLQLEVGVMVAFITSSFILLGIGAVAEILLSAKRKGST